MPKLALRRLNKQKVAAGNQSKPQQPNPTNKKNMKIIVQQCPTTAAVYSLHPDSPSPGHSFLPDFRRPGCTAGLNSAQTAAEGTWPVVPLNVPYSAWVERVWNGTKMTKWYEPVSCIWKYTTRSWAWVKNWMYRIIGGFQDSHHVHVKCTSM